MRAIADLERDLARRRAEGLARERRIVESPQGAQIRVGERTLLAFASNDYLGLANAPALIARRATPRCAGASARAHRI
jgi:8-amino-7-oxononanoate synthase